MKSLKPISLVVIAIFLSLQNGISQNWLLLGNAGTNPAINFLGTTDLQDLVVRSNNTERLRVRSNGLVNISGQGVGNAFIIGTGTTLPTTGTSNTGFGIGTLDAVTTGSNNTAFGSNALTAVTTGIQNTAVGSNSMVSNILGQSNTAVGHSSLTSNTANFNTAVGYNTLNFNTTGSQNTAVGNESLRTNATGASCTAVGYFSLRSNTASNNTAVGSQALGSNTSGNSNTAVGTSALVTNTTGTGSTAVGFNALLVTTGNSNTALGSSAGSANTTGTNNTYVGLGVGSVITTGTFNTFLGNNANTTAGGAAFTNSMALGNGALVDASDRVRIGNGAIGQIGGIPGWSTLSDARFKRNVSENVPGLEFIKLLKPVTYNLDRIAYSSFVGEKEETMDIPAMEEMFKERQTGFLAQEVEKAAKAIGYEFDGYSTPVNAENGTYSLKYSTFVVPLVKAVQELSIAVDEKDATISHLQGQVDDLQRQINDLKALVQGTVPAGKKATLGNNTPNPFNNTTVIGYTLPAQFNSAQIVVHDAKGSEVKKFNLQNNGQIEFDASSLSSGHFTYSLLVDGKLVETKKMVLNR